MTRVHCAIIIGVALCTALANTDVLRAVHLHQCHEPIDTWDATHPDRGQRSGRGHDAHKCTFCLQSASAKTILLDLTEYLGLPLNNEVEEPASFEITFWRSVSLSSLSPRAPPFAC